MFSVMPMLAEASVDACVTDPPYGIGFMGREWDTFKPGYRADAWAGYAQQPKTGASMHAGKYDLSVAASHAFQEWTTRWASEVLRVLKPGAYLLVCGAPRSFHRMAVGIEDAGFEIRDCLSWLYGQGFPKSLNLGDGRGTALKPGWEPIVLARKPFKGSVTANVEQHGTGALNVDACRLESSEQVAVMHSTDGRKFEQSHTPRERRNQQIGTHDLGRWPANVCLDEEVAALLDEQSGYSISRPSVQERAVPNYLNQVYGRGLGGVVTESNQHDDTGGASRFFYVAKPSRAERDLGCYDLVPRTAGEATDRQDGTDGLNSPRAGAGRTGGARNIHPTVKPVELMRWLVRLVTPQSLMVCETCDNVGHGNSTTASSSATSVYPVRPDVQANRQQPETEMLLAEMQQSREDVAAATVRVMRTGVSAGSKNQPVLFASVQQSSSGEDAADDEGLRDQREGIQVAVPAGPSSVIEGGLHHGASRSSGADARSAATQERSSSPQERTKTGQRPIQSRSDVQASARPEAETESQADSMSALPRLDRGVRTCPKCGATLVSHPGVVLDPFMGSGTTGMACAYEQRSFIGIEREAEYVAIAQRRIYGVAPLFGEAPA